MSSNKMLLLRVRNDSMIWKNKKKNINENKNTNGQLQAGGLDCISH